jgi:hypothetical protein
MGGLKRGRGVTLTTHPHLVAKVKNEQEVYLFSPQAPPWRVAGLFLKVVSNETNAIHKRQVFQDGLQGPVQSFYTNTTWLHNYSLNRGLAAGKNSVFKCNDIRSDCVCFVRVTKLINTQRPENEYQNVNRLRRSCSLMHMGFKQLRYRGISSRGTVSVCTAATLWRRSSFKCYLRIQSVPQREHHTWPLQRSTG